MGEAIEVGFALLPVRRVPLGDEVLACCPRLEDERTGPDRLLEEGIVDQIFAVEEVFRERPHPAKAGQEDGIRLSQPHRDGVIIDHRDAAHRGRRPVVVLLGALDHQEPRHEGAGNLFLEDAIERELDVGGGQRLAIAEGDVRSQLEGEFPAILGDRPLLRDVRSGLERDRVKLDELPVEHLAAPDIFGLVGEQGVDGVRLAERADDDRAAPGWRTTGRVLPGGRGCHVAVRHRPGGDQDGQHGCCGATGGDHPQQAATINAALSEVLFVPMELPDNALGALLGDSAAHVALL